MRKRVVVTGLGVVCPLGVSMRIVWPRLVQGNSGVISLPESFIDEHKIPRNCLLVGKVPRGEEKGYFNVDEWVDKKDQRRVSPFMQFAASATQQALDDANWIPKTENECNRTGVSIGTGVANFGGIVDVASNFNVKGYKAVSPYFIPTILANMPSGYVSIRHQLRGPNLAPATACATGLHAICDGINHIRNGTADVMLCGGTEASIVPLAMAGFARMKALASEKWIDSPQKASRPFDKERDGFVMAEGAAILTLEELEHAKRRGVRIYAEVSGFGLSGDAFHISASSGEGAQRAMKAALNDSSTPTTDVNYINAHGTSTPLGDKSESGAIKELFKQHASSISISSTKGATGHLLGASGALEAAFTVMSLFEGTIPPTLNFQSSGDPDMDLDYTPTTKRGHIRSALCNSFGFGGTNASVLFNNLSQ